MHAPYPSVPDPPRLAPRQSKGYQKPLKAVTPLPISIKFLTHNIAKHPPTSHILRRLRQGYHVLFLQELNKKPLVPHSFSMGANRAIIIANVPKRHEHGACLVFSPRLRPFLEPLPHPDKERLIAAALLHLPGAQPVLIASVYAPYNSSRAQTDRLRTAVQQTLQPLLIKYPAQILEEDFNTKITPSLDGHNMCSGTPWDWLASKVTSSPPKLIDAYRCFNPTAQQYTRYPQANHSSESRIDMIFYSPPASRNVNSSSSSILTDDKSTNHHPVEFHASSPPLPFRDQPTLRRRIFRRLKAAEAQRFTSALQPLADWCDSVTPHLDHLPLSEVQRLTDQVLYEVAGFFYDITAIKGSRSHGGARDLNPALASLPPPSSASFHTSMTKVNDEVKRCVQAEESVRNTKVHRCLVRCSRIKKTLSEALRPSDPPTLTLAATQTTLLLKGWYRTCYNTPPNAPKTSPTSPSPLSNGPTSESTSPVRNQIRQGVATQPTHTHFGRRPSRFNA